MSLLDAEIEQLRAQKRNTHFTDLLGLCRKYFGHERIRGSHHIFKMPWAGDPRINLQKVGGKAKPYQVDQVIDALERLNEANQAKDNIVRELKSGNRNGKKQT